MSSNDIPPILSLLDAESNISHASTIGLFKGDLGVSSNGKQEARSEKQGQHDSDALPSNPKTSFSLHHFLLLFISFIRLLLIALSIFLFQENKFLCGNPISTFKTVEVDTTTG